MYEHVDELTNRTASPALLQQINDMANAAALFTCDLLTVGRNGKVCQFVPGGPPDFTGFYCYIKVSETQLCTDEDGTKV